MLALLRRYGRPLRHVGGVALSVFLLWFVLRRVDLGEVGSTLREAEPPYLVPIAAIFFARYWLRAIRWRVLVAHLKAISARRILPRVLVAQAANLVLPFQLGYVLMVQITAKKFGLGRRELFGAESIERMMDGLVFALMLALALATLSIGDGFTGLTAFMLFGTFTGLGLAWLATRPRNGAVAGSRWSRFAPIRWMRGPQVQPFLQGLGSIQHPGQAATIFLLTAAIWLSEALLYWMVALSLGIHVSFLVHLFVVGAANIGAGMPVAQSSVGLVFLATQALIAVGVADDAALAYAVGVQGVIIVPSILLAPLAAYDMRLSWRDIVPRRAVEAPVPGTASAKA